MNELSTIMVTRILSRLPLTAKHFLIPLPGKKLKRKLHNMKETVTKFVWPQREQTKGSYNISRCIFQAWHCCITVNGSGIVELTLMCMRTPFIGRPYGAHNYSKLAPCRAWGRLPAYSASWVHPPIKALPVLLNFVMFPRRRIKLLLLR